jgi:hypothetical protein
MRHKRVLKLAATRNPNLVSTPAEHTAFEIATASKTDIAEENEGVACLPTAGSRCTFIRQDNQNHFVMVRIHARQPLEYQLITTITLEAENLCLPLACHLLATSEAKGPFLASPLVPFRGG